MTFRRLGPGEKSTGIHTVEALGAAGEVLARFDCDCQWCDVWRAAAHDCQWCDVWRAAAPMMQAAVRELDASVLGWLKTQQVA